MADRPEVDPASPLQFVINAAAGSGAADATRELIETELQAAGRRGDLRFCRPAELALAAQQAATRASTTRTAVVAVGGDGTINTVAQAAHALGCAMAVVPKGTFNYFARTHGIPADPAEAVRGLLGWTPAPVQVAAINDRVFLVNASLGLYPELLEDREAYKARFGRRRWVAFWAAGATLLRAQRKLRLHIEQGAVARDVRALTLFVGNNRLQLEHLGVEPQVHADYGPVRAPEQGHITAVMLRPIGTLSMLRLMLHGAMGTLGEAQSVEFFEFKHMVVTPTLVPGRRGVKVAYDGEVARMRAPLDFRVLAKPLYLLMPQPHDTATDTATDPAVDTAARPDTPTPARKATAMRSYPRNSPEAAARIVALVLIADGHVCSSEIDALNQIDAPRELELDPGGLPDIVQTLCEDLLMGDPGSGSMLGGMDDSVLASLMAEVDEPALQRKVLRLAVAAAQGDRHLAEGETLVLEAARRHWGISAEAEE